MDIPAAANELLAMRAERRIEADLSAALRPTTLDEAYAIQALVVDGLGLGGPIGFKCACTSPIAQEALGIDQPVFGRLLRDTTSGTGAALDASRFVHRVVEAEIGFRVGRDVGVAEGGQTADTIATFIDAAIPAIEIVDYRYESWTVGALQTAADNAIHGWWVHGEPVTDWHELDLAATEVAVELNGAVETTGSGRNVLGHPLNVMAWLANELPQYGLQLRAGDLVTTGVTTDVFEAEAGDAVVADFAGLGSVELGFV